MKFWRERFAIDASNCCSLRRKFEISTCTSSFLCSTAFLYFFFLSKESSKNILWQFFNWSKELCKLIAWSRWWLMVTYTALHSQALRFNLYWMRLRKSRCGKLTLTETGTCFAFKWNLSIDFNLSVEEKRWKNTTKQKTIFEISKSSVHSFCVLRKSLIEMNNFSGKNYNYSIDNL